jgi:hypothetical protein
MNADFVGARLVLWWVQVVQREYDEAIADIKREMEKPGLKTVKKLMLAYVNAAADNRDEASGLLWELEAKLQSESRLALMAAMVYAALGEKDRAFERLQLAFQIREPGLLFLKVSPWAEPLRSDPRYGALLERLGLG